MVDRGTRVMAATGVSNEAVGPKGTQRQKARDSSNTAVTASVDLITHGYIGALHSLKADKPTTPVAVRRDFQRDLGGRGGGDRLHATAAFLLRSGLDAPSPPAISRKHLPLSVHRQHVFRRHTPACEQL